MSFIVTGWLFTNTFISRIYDVSIMSPKPPYSITDKSRIEQLKTLLKNRERDEHIALLYDDDADGLTAGVFAYHGLKKLGFTNITTCPKAEDRQTYSSAFLQNLSSMEVKTIVCVDFEPISWKLASPAKIVEHGFDVIIIDHHFDQTELYDNLNTQNEQDILFIHPLNTTNSDNASQYCCAKFVYDVFSEIVDISEFRWKQAIGIIGDMNIIKWGDFTRDLLAEFGTKISDGDRKAFFTCPYGIMANTIGFAASQNSDDVEDFFQSYVNAKTVEELLPYVEKYKHVEEEFYYFIDNWEKYATYDETHKLYFVRLELKNMLAGLVSSVISYINYDYSFCFYQHNKQKSYHMSMRSQRGEVHLGKLLQHVASKFKNANGGGHAPAAGGICNESNFDEFVERIKESFDKFKIEKD